MQFSGKEDSREDIERQLQLMMQSRLFKGARRLGCLLQYIVTESVEGRGEQLKGITIATHVYGCKMPVDEQHLNMVRIYAGRLRVQLKKYYSIIRDEDGVMIRIPKGGYQARFTFMHKAALLFICSLASVWW